MLLFTKTAGFRHGSISDAVQGVGQAGFARGCTVTHTENAAAFTDAGLAAYDVAVFLLTTGDVLDEPQRLALTTFINGGGGWAGVHSASDTLHTWPWYGSLVGAYFSGHWSVVETRLVVAKGDHAATRHLSSGEWFRADEWYSFNVNPRPSVSVLLSVDESHYGQLGVPPDLLMGDHPIAWGHEYDGGRVFYTAMGHTSESYTEPTFLAHVTGGIEWAAGLDAPVGP